MNDQSRRPTLTRAALRRWLPTVARRTPDLVSAYLVPGRVSPRSREAAMLGVTSVNQCHACARVHERWGRSVGLETGGGLGFTRDEAAAYAYGQALAVHGPRKARPPAGLRDRHRRELEAAGVLMQLANLGGNRFLPERPAGDPMQIGNATVARAYDLVMRMADHAGMRRARARIVRGAGAQVLEIGIGTGLNLAAYPSGTSIQGVDPSPFALALAARRADQLGRDVTLTTGGAAALPFPDCTFDTVVGTFVLCSIGDVAGALGECRRVLRPGGTLRFLEHARSERPGIARSQARLAPAWSRVSGGCRLDHDVVAALESAGLRIIERRSHVTGLLMEIVAASD